MRKVVGILGICVASSFLWSHLLADTPDSKPESKPEAEAHQDEPAAPQTAEEIRQRLHESISLKLDKVPLDDALVEILRRRNLDFWYDDEQIKESNVRLDSIEVTCDLKNVSIRAALKRILKQAQLGWVCDDTGLRITSEAVSQSTIFARIYAVQALLPTPEVEVAVPVLPHQQPQIGSRVVQSGDTARESLKSPDPAPGTCTACATPQTDTCSATKKLTPEDILIRTILQTTGGPPNAPWMEADGEGGAIHLIQTNRVKLLVIRQNELGHEEIENLLNELISHQHSGTDEAVEEVPAEKNASRNIVRPQLRTVVKRATR